MRCLSLLSLALAALLASAQDAGVGASVGGPASPSGVRAQAPVDVSLHMRNTGGMGRGGPGTGAGLCVFTSIEVCSRYQNVPALDGWQKWMTSRPGGGYPKKVDAMLKAYCAEKGVPVPKYLQVEGDDLAILELCGKTGRPAGITYGISPTGRYGGKAIDHMVTFSHGKADEWAVIDNNYPGSWEWMSRVQFQRAYKGRGQGWCVILLESPPPPPPSNDLPPEPK